MVSQTRELRSDDLVSEDEELSFEELSPNRKKSRLSLKKRVEEKPIDIGEVTATENRKSTLQNLNNNELCMLFNQIKNDDKIGAVKATDLILEMFDPVVRKLKCDSKLSEQKQKLEIIDESIRHLKIRDKFDVKHLTTNLYNTFSTLPLEFVWWLDKHKILYFVQYCIQVQPNDLTTVMSCLMDEEKKSIHTDEIISDIFAYLLNGCFGSRLRLSTLTESDIWYEFCSNTLEQLIDAMVSNIEQETSCPSILTYTRTTNVAYPKIILHRFCKMVVKGLVSTRVDEYSIYDAYTAQILWTTNKMPKNLYAICVEMINLHLTFADVLEILDDFNYKVNLRYTLLIISVFLKLSKQSIANVKDEASKFLEESFQNGDMTKVVYCLLFVRHIGAELGLNYYEEWFVETVGINSTHRVIKTPTLFKFFIETMGKLIPYEDQCFLEIYKRRGIRAPTKLNNLVLDYKSLCKNRSQELRQYPVIKIMDIEMSVLHLIEQSFPTFSPILLFVINTQPADFRKVILPILNKGNPICAQLKTKLLNDKLVKEAILKVV